MPQFPKSGAPPSNSTQNLFAGTSGWAYPTWKPGFYIAGTPARAFLTAYASRLNSVEVNYTFRTLPTPTQLQTWLSATPPGFRFSFKAPQRITHFQRLRDSQATLAEFIAALAPVQEANKLGPLLFQLPPNFAADPDRLNAFLQISALTSQHLQLAFEFRHPSWFTDEIYAILRRRNAALCIAESDDITTPEVHTADFFCYRLRHNGAYSLKRLKALAATFTNLAATGELFAYFKHEDEPTGPLNAEALLHQVSKIAGAR